MLINNSLQEANNLLQKGDYKNADRIFSRLLQLDPDNHLFLFLKGLTSRQSGNIRQCIEFIEKAITKCPDSALYYHLLGDILLESDRTEEAIIAYQKETHLVPSYAQAIINPELLQYLNLRNTKNNKGPFCCFSFPKCGTNLLSDIVQHITGLTCHWPETTILSLDILHGIPSGQFLIGHFSGNPQCFDFFKYNGFKIIANYRDPRDQLVSFYFYYKEIYKKGNNEWGHLLRKFNKEQAINILMSTRLSGGIAHPSNMANWIGSLLEFARRGIPVLFLTFEDIVQNKLESIRRIAGFLGYEVSGGRIQEIVAETSFDKKSDTVQKKGLTDNDLKRKGIVGDWRNHFTQSNRDTFNAVAGRLLSQLGYELC